MSYDDDNDGCLREQQEQAEEADYPTWIADMESLAAHDQFLNEMSK